MKHDRDLVEEALRRHGEVYAAMHATSIPEWCRLELTMAQLKALLVVGHGDGRTVGALARELRVALPSASGVVDRLVEHGLAAREEDRADRRRIHVRLTPAGERLRSELLQGQDVVRSWLCELAPADLEALVQGLRALAAVLPGAQAVQPAAEAVRG